MSKYTKEENKELVETLKGPMSSYSNWWIRR